MHACEVTEYHKCKNHSDDQHAANYQVQSAAERAQTSLARRVEALAALISPELAEEKGVQALLEGVWEDLDAQSIATHKLIKYISCEFRRPDAAAPLARRVFGTPELLKRILLLVDTRTAFCSYRVCKDFFNTIEGSLKLQRKLALMLDLDSHISYKGRVFLNVVSGMSFSMYSTPHTQTDDGPEAAVWMVAGGWNPHMMLPGPRLRSIQLMQPPIRDLKVRTSCCDSRYPSTSTRMHTVTGITVGELRDKVVELRKAHRMCSYADHTLHDDDGFVFPEVTFSGKLRLREDDYTVVVDRTDKKERNVAEKEQREIRTRMTRYIDAKRGAERFQLPVPTLAEFEAERERRRRLAEDKDDA